MLKDIQTDKTPLSNSRGDKYYSLNKGNNAKVERKETEIRMINEEECVCKNKD